MSKILLRQHPFSIILTVVILAATQITLRLDLSIKQKLLSVIMFFFYFVVLLAFEEQRIEEMGKVVGC